jgi:hypothetical protein
VTGSVVTEKDFKAAIKGQKALARLKRRRRLARLLLFLFLFFGVGAASVPPQYDLVVEVQTVTRSQQFDFVDWVSREIAIEIGRRLTPPPLPADPIEQGALVKIFLEQEEQILSLEHEINQLYAAQTSPARQVAPLQAELAEARADQARITPQVEMILARQVEAALRDEGFTVLPPVVFRFIDPPTALILSPRDQIKNQYSLNLQPGLDNVVRSQIEEALERRGDVSSYVTDIGGLGSYPTMVIRHPHLPYLLDIIAHEWVHNYLYTFPTNIAWEYQTYPRLTTINETAASLVGAEVSRKVITRFYPEWLDQLPPLDPNGQPAPAKPSEFHSTMRRIRQTVDQLLAEGRLDEAEALMETERLKLVEKGHNLRRLNQAYFAFHGSYALSPGSIDPIGPQIRQLRAASPSLKDFLDRVGWLNSYEDYVAWLEDQRLKK